MPSKAPRPRSTHCRNYLPEGQKVVPKAQGSEEGLGNSDRCPAPLQDSWYLGFPTPLPPPSVLLSLRHPPPPPRQPLPMFGPCHKGVKAGSGPFLPSPFSPPGSPKGSKSRGEGVAACTPCQGGRQAGQQTHGVGVPGAAGDATTAGHPVMMMQRGPPFLSPALGHTPQKISFIQ